MTSHRPAFVVRPGRRAALSFAVASALVLGSRAVAVSAPIKVSCVGEHTTHSDLYSNSREQQPPGMQEYPLKMQAILGSGYDVRNHGDCCASVVQGYPSSETHPYVSGSNYKNSMSFQPDIVVIGSWGRHDWGLSRQTAAQVFSFPKFETDYEDMVKRYVNAAFHPKIYCSTPIPILFGNDGPDNGFQTSPAAAAIKRVAAKYNLPVIDLYTAFLGHKELFRSGSDKDNEGEHVNDAGMQKIAEVVAAALKAGPATTDGGVPTGGTDGGGGGAATDGGPSAGSAGASGTGGSVGMGGTVGTGGTTGTGGTAETAGTSGTAGSGAPTVTGSSGSTGAGGTAVITGIAGTAGGSGPSVGTGGAATGGTAPRDVGGSQGCACAMGSGSNARLATAASVALAAIALQLGRRRRSRQGRK